ncbi:MAG: hypothetical protein H7Y20_03860 [Bryobacteraceae bacterium]|nr:hypothetical protein [Bryobacteraceae bacterium]
MPRIFVAQAIAASLLSAQPLAKRTPDQLKASYEAHKSDFDYLLGDWEFTSESQEYGKFGGRWSAVRLDTGQILDEYRVLGENSQTLFATSTIRAFNAATDRWELIGMTSGGGLQDFGTGRRMGSEVHIEQKFQGRKVNRCSCESNTTTSNQVASHGLPTGPMTADRPGSLDFNALTPVASLLRATRAP